MPTLAFETTTYRSLDVRAGTLLVQLDPDASDTTLNQALLGVGHFAGDAGPGGLQTLVLDPGQSLEHALSLISQLPGVRTAEPDYVYHALDDLTGSGASNGNVNAGTDETGFDVSNDPGVTGGQAWGMYGDTTTRVNAFGSQAGEAWTAGYTGSTKVAVGLVDTGVDYTAPDLYLNIWLNQNEIPVAFKANLTDVDGDGRITFRDLNAAANAAYVTDVNGNGRIDAGDLLHDNRWSDGVDQDNNGLTDDLIGWDFLNNDNDPMDDVGHGTHVAGIIAAQGGNGIGVAGVTWSTQLIVAKFLGPDGGFSSDAASALDYVTAASTAAGAINVVATNNSWGGTAASFAVSAAIGRGATADILFVAAAGNGGADQIGDNNDSTPTYPASYDTLGAAGYDAVISVASITSTGGLSSFSNYGVASVDLGAPGSTIYSTLPGGLYGNMSGTSMATPFVTGAIALYAAAVPGASAAQIRADLLASTIPTASLAGKTVTGGRLDVSSFVYRGSPGGVTDTGTAANDTFSLTSAPAGQSKASVFNDTLVAMDGADKLDGGPGADRMVGGPGNDTYTVENPGDVVVEQPNEGVDLVNSSISYLLGPNLEKLTLTGTAAINGTGNELANTITGNAGANVLTGADGDDILTGGAGTDTLIGGIGNDWLTGGTEADTMTGGPGDDTYDVDNAGDLVVELPGEGNDLVNSSISYVLGPNFEKLTLTGTAAINGTGNELANTITGNTGANVLTGADGDDILTGGAGTDTLIGGIGNDRLTGGTEADTMTGGPGDDTYDVDDAGDLVVELPGEGNDLVNASVSYTLAPNVERLTLTGTASIDATGNGLDNAITGNTGDNVLSGLDGADTLTGGTGNDTLLGGIGDDKLTGGLGADRMDGGAGNDTFYVDDPGDVVVEAPGEGNDLVSSAVSFTLSANVERLTLTGALAIDGTGNALANSITGNAAANLLMGADGADTLSGGAGDDTLDGGAGIDRLTGGAGADRFVFQTGQAAGDVVLDFALGDHLELHGYGAGSTLTKVVGSLTNWTVTDGVTHATEIITLANKYALAAGDYIFT
ncbi:S8 family serine peptidase [Phenylobacterium sp.]|uniref:S8 family serine peptidase n=1 Tax=Phenylobacterium sp. TaxID=1871053 RepID=UPI0025E15DE3|nr:S8 family serine peptidase [Phenylobacterium sp.]